MVQCVTFLPAPTQVRLSLSALQTLPATASVCQTSGITVADDAEHNACVSMNLIWVTQMGHMVPMSLTWVTWITHALHVLQASPRMMLRHSGASGSMLPMVMTGCQTMWRAAGGPGPTAAMPRAAPAQQKQQQQPRCLPTPFQSALALCSSTGRLLDRS